MEPMIYQMRCNKCGWVIEGTKRGIEAQKCKSAWVARHNSHCSGKIVTIATGDTTESSRYGKSYKNNAVTHTWRY